MSDRCPMCDETLDDRSFTADELERGYLKRRGLSAARGGEPDKEWERGARLPSPVRVPFYFDESVHVEPGEGQDRCWCMNCGLGLIIAKYGMALPVCVRCRNGGNWTFCEGDAKKTRQRWYWRKRLPVELPVELLASALESAHGAICADLEEGLDEVDELDADNDFWLKFASALLAVLGNRSESQETKP